MQDESVRLSVPTRFLKSWIQAHYAERVLACWQAEMPEVQRIDLTVRTRDALRVPPAKDADGADRCAPLRSQRRPARAELNVRRRPRRSPPAMTRSAARRSIRG